MGYLERANVRYIKCTTGVNLEAYTEVDMEKRIPIIDVLFLSLLGRG